MESVASHPRARLRRLVRAHVVFRRRLLRALVLVAAITTALVVVVVVVMQDGRGDRGEAFLLDEG